MRSQRRRLLAEICSQARCPPLYFVWHEGVRRSGSVESTHAKKDLGTEASHVVIGWGSLLLDSIFNVGDEATFEDEFSLFISLCFDVCFILLQETIEIVERKGKEKKRNRSKKGRVSTLSDDKND